MQGNRKETGQWLVPVLFGIAYIAILVAFAFQTYQLVSWLFPAQNWFMQVVTVFVFDGVALLCAGAEAFYHFHRRRAHQIVRVMWVLAFVGSCLCTGLWMILSASTKLDFLVPSGWLIAAYVIVTVAFILDAILGTLAFMVEWDAVHPHMGYDDEKSIGHSQVDIKSIGHSEEDVPLVPLAQSNGNRSKNKVP